MRSGEAGHRDELRVGMGYDIHRLVSDRPLVLGGVRIPFEQGLAGHSDADVLVHAIMDALLGAAGQGDIGQHFPPTDERWRDASSLDLLARVRSRLENQGLAVVNVDATVVAEAPRLEPYFGSMKARIAEKLCIDVKRVNVKATTAEGLGPEGRGEGVSARAIALLRQTMPQ